MPTKRLLRKRHRRDHEVPAWARHLLETGERPPRDTEDSDAFIGWRFFGDSVPGLPDADTPEGRDLIGRSTEPAESDEK